MKVFWWQTGLHIEPENAKEFEALCSMTEFLYVVDSGQGVPGSPIVNSGNQQSVGIMDKSS